MKPIKLSIEGLNSFRQKQTIDFEELGRDNLFCISGSTGSGKTTIVDAIILALYGSTKRGTLEETVNLNCQKAIVELTIELEGEVYIIVREIRKTKTANKAMAYKSDLTMVASGATEVNEFVAKKIGLGKDQFTRVVMLQQGEFDRFLSDNRGDRMKVIEKLTDIDKYDRIVKMVNNDEKEAKKDLDMFKSALEAYADVSDEILIQKRAELERIQAEEKDLIQQKAERVKIVDEAKKKLAEYKVFKERELKINGLEKELADIEKDFVNLENDKKNSITYQEKRDKILEQIGQNGKKREEISGYLVKAEQAKNITDGIQRALKEYKLTKDEKEKKETELAGYLSKIDLIKKQYGFSETNAKEISRQESNLYTELYSAYTSQQVVIKDLTNREKEYSECEQKIKEQSLIAGLTEQGKNIKVEECAKVKARLEQVEEMVDKLRSNNALGVLMSKVKVGDVCPVCGNVVTSLSHVDGDGDITKALEELKSTKERYAKVTDELTKAEQAHASTITVYASMQENLSTLKQKIEDLKKDVGIKIEYAQVKERESRVNFAKEFENCVVLVESLKSVINDKDKDLKKRKEEGEILRKQQVDLQNFLIEKCETYNDIEIKEKITELREKDVLLEREKNELDNFLKALLEREIQILEKKKNKQEQLDSLKKENTYCEKIDQAVVEEVETLLKKTEAEILRVVSEKSSLGTRIKDIEIRLETKKEKEKECELKQKKYDNLKELKDIFKGSAFTDFVADAFIDEITDYASEQLSDLSSSQYTMCYNDGAFYVNDHLSDGEKRNVTTLSGGEKFLASLSLAIAISRRTAQSRDYGFFFIDEGFGTLDETTLETVCASLEKLADDTMVGVITHRSELIERIPSVLKVNKADGDVGSICTLKM